MLSEQSVRDYRRNGFLLVQDALPDESLAVLRRELDGWITESIQHQCSWGETIDGRARFDVAPSHNPASPALRRVDNPQCISTNYRNIVLNGVLANLAVEVIGPNIKFHHSKINLKLPSNRFAVDYHQDFSYTPHTNDDLVTILLLLDDMGEDDGVVMVVPGSHREGQKSLWQGDTFTGKVDDQTRIDCEARAKCVTGNAGSAILMHTSLLHASEQNVSNKRRGLLISVYSAADAYPLSPSPVPNEFEGVIVRGEGVRSARTSLSFIELPENYRASSFFSIQKSEMT
ncbi:MAG: restriction endonuclease subunit S [Acidiferrobacteraceae bacterium]|nr:restriction endonuclease subunit S [Acidiferrobacteraceae bacterium]